MSALVTSPEELPEALGRSNDPARVIHSIHKDLWVALGTPRGPVVDHGPSPVDNLGATVDGADSERVTTRWTSGGRAVELRGTSWKHTHVVRSAVDNYAEYPQDIHHGTTPPDLRRCEVLHTVHTPDGGDG